jgi:hypothetical protein
VSLWRDGPLAGQSTAAVVALSRRIKVSEEYSERTEMDDEETRWMLCWTGTVVMAATGKGEGTGGRADETRREVAQLE